VVFGSSILEGQIPTLYVTCLKQSFSKRGCLILQKVHSRAEKHSNNWHCGLLCVRSERPCHRSATHALDELAP
jgi:hypothetical protein